MEENIALRPGIKLNPTICQFRNHHGAQSVFPCDIARQQDLTIRILKWVGMIYDKRLLACRSVL